MTGILREALAAYRFAPLDRTFGVGSALPSAMHVLPITFDEL